MENKTPKKRRENGTGSISKRGDRYIGRMDVTRFKGYTANGKRTIKFFSGKTPAEVRKKMRTWVESETHFISSKMLFKDYADNWMKLYKKQSIKGSSYDRLENTLKHQVFPYLGEMVLDKITADDIQRMLSSLKSGGKSYSTIKKAYDATGSILKHARLNGNIVNNPIDLVECPGQRTFETKEPRCFTAPELRALIVEFQRKYKTGTPVYPYGEAFVLALNTGIRVGELIALQKTDWDPENRMLHIMRSLEAIKNRDENEDRTGGYTNIVTTTKTYSSERYIYCNDYAKEAIETLIQRYPDTPLLICNSKGKMLLEGNLYRSFNRALENLGMEKAGLHALRHTFASFLFQQKMDVKTVSQILGHSTPSVTLNRYIHLINSYESQKGAVSVLDSML